MSRPIEILLVEANPQSVRVMEDALESSRIRHHLRVAADGVEALKHLRQSKRLPDLILLELKLSKKDGHEVLAEIKGAPELKAIPVVVLTSSADEEDILRAYEFHANCYVKKPANKAQLVKVLKSIENFWLVIAKLPGGT
jgi:CheY-like chemotaxis protein